MLLKLLTVVFIAIFGRYKFLINLPHLLICLPTANGFKMYFGRAEF